ncbi:MAG: LysM repeat protein [Paracoccaceae bacterium]|jgi:LysM repeat protein
MRKFLFLIAVMAGAGFVGTSTKEAQAQCSHLGSSGTCPVGIPNGSNSVTINADGTINWNSGGISGPCCAPPSGTETGAGLLNLNNQLGSPVSPGNQEPVNPEDSSSSKPTAIIGVDPDGRTIVIPTGWNQDQCSGSQCTGGVAETVFGAGPNGGYGCGSGSGSGPSCGLDQWPTVPQTGFGQCGPSGCGGTTGIRPIGPAVGPTGVYAQNLTSGNVDPFGGGFDVFLDPDTGDVVDLDDDRSKWPERVQHADDLNSAYVNGEISFYPFSDPDWATKSVEDMKNSTPPPTNEQAGSRFDATPAFIGDTPALTFPTGGRAFNPGPYAQNATTGNFDPFGGGGSFTDPRTGESVALPDNQADWPDKYKKAAELNTAYANGQIRYPFNDSDWENKSADDFPIQDANASTFVNNLPTEPAIRGENIPPPHDVKVNETLEDLADRYGVTVDDIKAANGLIVDELTLGQTLQIPASLPEDNSDLTNYVVGVLAAIEGRSTTETDLAYRRRTDIAYSGAFGDTPVRLSADEEGNYYVFVPDTGEEVITKNPSLAQQMATDLRNGKPFKDVLEETYGPDSDPATRDTGAVARSTEFVDALRDSVPKEFRAPSIRVDKQSGEDDTFVVTDPKSGKTFGFSNRESAEAMTDALRKGETPSEADKAGQAVETRIEREESARQKTADATTIVTTKDGLASASVPGARTQTTIVPRPPRLAGESVGVMEEALFKGSVYKLEIIKTPDGRTFAVGTGEHAGHVFGETKDGSFGWRREGPWTPPPAPAPFIGDPRPAIIVSPTPTELPGGRVVTDLPGKIEPGDTVTVREIGGDERDGDGDATRVSVSEGSDRDRETRDTGEASVPSAFLKAPITQPKTLSNADQEIRIGIANSDRDYMTGPIMKSFRRDDRVSFSSTGR